VSEYRVNLDIYNGPLDLLLYLIKRDELDIQDIPIARITEQYLHYVEMLKQLDPNLAGEFLVMAASLVEIKSRMLLPTHGAVEDEGEDLAIDPREELVRQLLEYKAFKDAAHDLSDAAEVQAMRYPRRPADLAEQGEDFELEDLQIWDLFDAFRKVLDAIGQISAHHQVIVDDTPQALYREDLLDRLRRDGALPFRRIFEGRESRAEVIGLFLALLELCKLRRIRVCQTKPAADIQVDLREETEDDELDQAEAENAPATKAQAEEEPEYEAPRAFEPPEGDDVRATRYARTIDTEEDTDDVLAADRQAQEELDAIPEIDIDDRLAEYEELRELHKLRRETGDDDPDDDVDEDFADEDEEDVEDNDDDLDEADDEHLSDDDAH
jgi:segregation and condensation protein A